MRRRYPLVPCWLLSATLPALMRSIRSVITGRQTPPPPALTVLPSHRLPAWTVTSSRLLSSPRRSFAAFAVAARSVTGRVVSTAMTVPASARPMRDGSTAAVAASRDTVAAVNAAAAEAETTGPGSAFSRAVKTASSSSSNNAPHKSAPLRLKRNFSESSNSSSVVSAASSVPSAALSLSFTSSSSSSALAFAAASLPSSPNSSSSASASAYSGDDASATSSSGSASAPKRQKTLATGGSGPSALANGSSVGTTGFVAVDSALGMKGVLAHLTPSAGWFAPTGGDMRLMVRRVPSPNVKRSVQTKQLRLLLTLRTADGESLTVPYLLADLCDKKGVSNKPGSKQFPYAAYMVQASDAVPALTDPNGRKFEVVVLLTCEANEPPTKTTMFSSAAAKAKRASTAMPNNIRSRHAAEDPTDRMNLTLLYQTEPKFVAYRVRYFVRQMDTEDGVAVAPTNSAAAGATVASRMLDLVEFGHNGKPTAVAHAGFVPVLEDFNAMMTPNTGASSSAASTPMSD